LDSAPELSDSARCCCFYSGIELCPLPNASSSCKWQYTHVHL